MFLILNNTLKNIKTKLKNKSGLSTLEWIICVFMFIMIFSFLIDLFFLAYKQFRVSSEASNIMRVLSNQSGVEKTVPYNYPGGTENYLTVNGMYDRLDKAFKGLQIDEDDWSAQITMQSEAKDGSERSITLEKDKEGIKSDYRDYITLKLTYKYKWGLWSQFIPADITGSIEVERHGFSEWKEDYNTWEGEHE